ncbi:MAG: ZIP family metal transporter, partial [Tepidanaerobacteraceae bacterium]|nr:ZIP family metal transporter [Tepidanaerobacteraceae bacterium]
METVSTTLLSFIAGVGGTGIGGFYTFFLREVKADKMTSVLGFASGIMIAAVFLELVPEAVRISGLIHTLIGIIIGMIFLICSDMIIESVMPQDQNIKQHFARAGVMLFLAIACHNFPEGIAIGSGFEVSHRVGLVLVVTLALHNIPEGMAIATALRLSGMGPLMAFLSTMLAGTPMVIGALLGQKLGRISPALISVSLGFAAGAMIYTVCKE